jgi:cytochrome c556
MKSYVIGIVVIAGIVVGSSAVAATGLKAMMKGWKTDRAIAEQMLTGRTAYDEAEMRRILEGFISGAQTIQAKVSGANARSKDVGDRFGRFASDSSAARASLAKQGELKIRFAAAINNCRTCHDVYAN